MQSAHATGWYRIVAWGTGPYRMPPTGPWPSAGEADAALQRWRERAGDMAGTIEAAHSVRVYGPYASRREARQGDISEPVQG